MNQAEQKARIIALERAAEKDAKAIAYLRASTIEVERIIALEQQAARDAEIGIERGERIERLETAVLDLHERVGKLEAALRQPRNWLA